jgi:hypothetical protein
MEIRTENKNGSIYIGFNELGSYLFYNKTVSSTWYCCYGTLAKFLCTADINERTIREIESIQSKLYIDYTDKLESLSDVLRPIIKKLKSGNYVLSFVSGQKKSIELNGRKLKWDIYIEQSDYKFNRISELAFCYYDNLDYRFIGTQNTNSIDRQTVLKYESEIRIGKRPFAIVMSSYYQPETDKHYPYEKLGGYDADWDSECFILDGHHKLLAYKNLGIEPSFALIHQRVVSMSNSYFNFIEFSNILNDEQINHFKKNWESSEKYSNGNRIKY